MRTQAAGCGSGRAGSPGLHAELAVTGQWEAAAGRAGTRIARRVLPSCSARSRAGSHSWLIRLLSGNSSSVSPREMAKQCPKGRPACWLQCSKRSAQPRRPTCQKTSTHHGTRSACLPRAAGCCCCHWMLPAGHLPQRQCPAVPQSALLPAAAAAAARRCTAPQAAAAAAALPSCLPRCCCWDKLHCRAAAAARVVVPLAPLSPRRQRGRPFGRLQAAAAFQAAFVAGSV